MLSQLHALEQMTPDRYATDEDLQFLDTFGQAFPDRRALYLLFQSLEEKLVEETYQLLEQKYPEVLRVKGMDFASKWKADTLRVLRYTAAAILLNDSATFQERFLLWFQTIMRAFGVRRNCYITYEAMKVVIHKHLTPSQFQLVEPLLNLTQETLGGTLEEFKAP